MTILIYFTGSFVLFLMVLAFGRGQPLREALASGLAVCGLPLAAIVLWMPYRIDVGSILPVRYPYEEDSQRLTQIIFSFGCFFFACVCVAFWLSTLKKPSVRDDDGPK
ncbi:MAG TPA: hypothetical protein DDW52_00355 [Planctomycetaceae bacterium]|nr:hypothetical protein [Planctomycetaceae bacterium]